MLAGGLIIFALACLFGSIARTSRTPDTGNDDPRLGDVLRRGG